MPYRSHDLQSKCRIDRYEGVVEEVGIFGRDIIAIVYC